MQAVCVWGGCVGIHTHWRNSDQTWQSHLFRGNKLFITCYQPPFIRFIRPVSTRSHPLTHTHTNTACTPNTRAHHTHKHNTHTAHPPHTHPHTHTACTPPHTQTHNHGVHHHTHTHPHIPHTYHTLLCGAVCV